MHREPRSCRPPTSAGAERSHRLWVATVPLLLTLAPATLAQPLGDRTVTRPGVRLTYGAGVDPQSVEAIADVIATAKAAFDELFPELAQRELRVNVWDATDAYYEGVITDRLSAIHIGIGRMGLGEAFRGGECPVFILCQAVAEVHNPGRLPGFDRYIAARFFAKAVAEALVESPLPRTKLTANSGDPTGRLALMADAEYAVVHPDFAAVAALLDIEQAIGFDSLKQLLLAGLQAEGDAGSTFRAMAVEGEPALASAFELYDEAMRLETDGQGDCVVASFEPDEGVRVLTSFLQTASRGDMPIVASNLLEPSFTDEWATDGNLSLSLHAEETRPYLGLILSDPDWKYKDWTRFSRLQMDLRYEGPAPTEVYAHVADDVGRGHASLGFTGGRLAPGEERHVDVSLTPDFLANGRPRANGYYDGTFRAREVAALQITVPDPPGPFTLYVDNIRLTPKPEALMPERAAAADERPPTADADAEAQAAAAVEAALALKRAGNLQEAEGRLREALQLDPDHINANRVLGWVLVDLGRTAEAAEQFRRVLALEPDEATRREITDALDRLR